MFLYYMDRDSHLGSLLVQSRNTLIETTLHEPHRGNELKVYVNAR